MLIADVAQQVGVKVSTIRFYLRSGLLAEPERTAGGYRRFTADEVRRARFLRRGQELGFTLAELASLDVLSQQARTGAGTDDLVAHGRAKLADIDARIRDLRRTRDALAALLDAPAFDADADCPVVAALADAPCDEPVDPTGAGPLTSTGATSTGSTSTGATSTGATSTGPTPTGSTRAGTATA